MMDRFNAKAADVKRILIAALFFFLAVNPASFAFTLRFAPSGEPVRWPEEGSAIFYLVSTRDGEVHGRKVEALDRAFHSWQKNLPGNISFVFAGSSEQRRAERDGTNLLVWVYRDWEHGPEVAALATTWYCPVSGLIDEVDIEFNARDYEWSTSRRGEGLDLESVALHEIGHLLGLGHSFHPSAVMHDTVSPGPNFSRSLTRDDLEGAWLLYSPIERRIVLAELPGLFSSRSSSPDASGGLEDFSPDFPGLHITALGSVFAYNGAPSAVAMAGPRGDGSYLVKIADLPYGGLEARTICPPAEFSDSVRITGVTGIDYGFRGARTELAVISREDGEERISIYDVKPGYPVSDFPLFSSVLQPASSANNLLGVASLDAGGDGYARDLAVLRAVTGGFSLALYSLPREGGVSPAPLAPSDRFAISVKKGSELLGLAAADVDGTGGEELLVLERTGEGVYRLYAYRLKSASGGGMNTVEHFFSALLPDGIGGLLPSQISGVDTRGDGLLSGLAILSRMP